MSQISPPMRILIAGAVVFLAVWFTLLRPKADVAPATTTTPAGNVNTGAPAESTAGKIVEKAKSAATTAEGAAKAAAGESTATTTPQTAAGSTTTTAPDATAAAPAVPAATLAALPKDVAGAITGRKVLVLAVLTTDAKPWRPLADDDRYVRNTLKKVNRYDGQVLVKQVPLDQLVTYAPLVNDLHVDQTPSIVVVDPKLKASVLEGYVDRVSINQAIADARRAGTDQLITDAFLKQANQVCASGNVSLDRWSQPTVRGKKARLLAGKRAQALMRSYRRAVGKLVAPKAWKGLKREWLAELAGEQKVLDKAVGALKSQDAAGWNAMILTWNPADARKLDHRFDAAGLTSCSQLRRQ